MSPAFKKLVALVSKADMSKSAFAASATKAVGWLPRIMSSLRGGTKHFGLYLARGFPKHARKIGRITRAAAQYPWAAPAGLAGLGFLGGRYILPRQRDVRFISLR